MYFKIEYFRIIHYFYFYLGSIGAISAFAAWSGFQQKGIVLLVMALANLYFSYRAELKVREIVIESRLYNILSHILIAGMALAYYFIFIGREKFAFFESTLLITTYVCTFTSLMLVLFKLDFFRKLMLFLEISKEHIAIKRILLLKEKKSTCFKDVFDSVDTEMLKSYSVGTSQKIDSALRGIFDAATMDNVLWNLKFLFIYLYERKLPETKEPYKKEKIIKTISKLKENL